MSPVSRVAGIYERLTSAGNGIWVLQQEQKTHLPTELSLQPENILECTSGHI